MTTTNTEKKTADKKATTKKATTKKMSIYEALPLAQATIGPVGKDGQNTYDRYAYRTIDAVMDAAHKAFVEANIVAVPTVLEREQVERASAKGQLMIHTTLTVKYTFYAPDGTSIEAVVQGEGMDRGDKSINKAMSAAYKYAMFQVLAIPTSDMIDSETESPEIVQTVSPEVQTKLDEISQLMQQTGYTTQAVEQRAKTTINAQTPTQTLDRTIKFLTNVRAKREAEAMQELKNAADQERSELEALQDELVDRANAGQIDLAELEEQSGQSIVEMDVKALKAALAYIDKMVAKKQGDAA